MTASQDKELKLIEKAATEFARKELAPNREENDKYPFGPFFRDTLRKAYEVDFFHTILPESLNGMGQGMTGLCVLLDAICQEDSSPGAILLTTFAAQQIMLLAGAEEPLNGIVSKAESVEDFLIAMPMFNNPSEIHHVANASGQDGGFRVSGPLEYVVLGGLAKRAMIPCCLNGGTEISFFLVDLDSKTVRKSDPVLSLGLNACPAVDLEFQNTEAVLIGKEGEGPALFERMTDRMHLAAAAMATGIMKGSFREAFDYSQKRMQGGREIVKWSEMKMILANMAIKIKNAEMILESGCRAVDEKEPRWKEGARAAALLIQEMACDVTTDGIQVLGGVGYMKDFGQEKRFRDAKHIQALFGLAPMKKIRYIEKMIKKC